MCGGAPDIPTLTEVRPAVTAICLDGVVINIMFLKLMNSALSKIANDTTR
jgi:hypothetical protein